MVHFVVVCIATYKRPLGLERVLESLRDQTFKGRMAVVVADNDTAGTGLAVAARLRPGYPRELVAVPAPERGISSARNATVNAAFHHFPDLDAIASIDDDMWATPSWLDELVRGLDHWKADLANGPVVPQFEVEPQSWMVMEGFFGSQKIRNGIIPSARATNNLIVRAAVYGRYLPAPFAREFGLSGGEDVDFAFRCKRDGAVAAWLDTAVAYEFIPTTRMTESWLRSRATRVGNSNVRVQRRSHPGLHWELLRLSRTVGLVGIGLVALATARSRESRLRAFLMLDRARGKIQAHVGGSDIQEYERTHGR